MAVAVKNNPESLTQGLFDRKRLAVGSLLGTVYVIGCLGVVFQLLPVVWWNGLGLSQSSLLAWAGLLVLEAGAIVGLTVVGVRLMGSNPPHGLRAGIFAGLVGVLIIGFLTWAIGMILESFTPDTVGLLVTVVVGVVLLAGYGYLFFVPKFEQGLMQLEDQGWFSAAAYKRSQGQQVRRGTILGLIILFGCGIYTLAHKTLETSAHRDWELTLPFTKATLESPGDLALLRSDLIPEGEAPAKGTQIDKRTFREANNRLKDSVKIKDSGDSPYQVDQIVPKTEFDAERRQLAGAEGKRPPVSVATTPATAKFATVTILPDVRFSLPLLLFALSLWLSYRVVNYPVFADFLIATEAELKKVSWTTRKRLVQDTYVVLITVILLTLFLFVVDIAWGQILSWKYIGVLQVQKDQQQQTTTDQEQPW